MARIENKTIAAQLIKSGIRAFANATEQTVTEAEENIAGKLGVAQRTLQSWKNSKSIPGNIDDSLLQGFAWLVVSKGGEDLQWLTRLLSATSEPVVEPPTRDWVLAYLRRARFGSKPPPEDEIQRVVDRLFSAERESSVPLPALILSQLRAYLRIIVVIIIVIIVVISVELNRRSGVPGVTVTSTLLPALISTSGAIDTSTPTVMSMPTRTPTFTSTPTPTPTLTSTPTPTPSPTQQPESERVLSVLADINLNIETAISTGNWNAVDPFFCGEKARRKLNYFKGWIRSLGSGVSGRLIITDNVLISPESIDGKSGWKVVQIETWLYSGVGEQEERWEHKDKFTYHLIQSSDTEYCVFSYETTRISRNEITK